ncbi:MAG TPA: response regulator transcription factor [Thermoanaerobaculia bacterium]
MDRLEEVLATDQPAVALVSLDLPGLGGSDGLKTVRRISPTTKVIAMSNNASGGEELDVLRTGAKGYVSVDHRADIPKVVEKVQEGEVWAARRTIGQLLDEIFSEKMLTPSDRDEGTAELRERVRALTTREQQILHLLAEGSSNKEIASELNVTVSTVKAHLTKIFRKLGQPDRLRLVLATRPAAR